MTDPGSAEPSAALAEAFEHLGRLRFDEYMELALYAPASGFFATTGQAGRSSGDFITSAEVGPLFGAVVSRRLDRLWEDLGRPDPFTVVEAGAGRGALALAVRAASPRCSGALHWVMVERSASLRSAHGRHLEITEGAPTGRGPWFSSAADLPPGPLDGAVVANELLDNIEFRLMERGVDGWLEVYLERSGGGLVEVAVRCEQSVAARLDELVPDATVGSRVPWQGAASAWVQRALSLVRSGLVLVFDYGRTTVEMAGLDQAEWLRTYAGHERAGSPLEAPGTRDITVDVALDQLPEPDLSQTQAGWLRDNGIEDLVADAARRWEQEAAAGGLDALRARSVPLEADALTDPAGLGAFATLEWWRGPAGNLAPGRDPGG